MTPTNGHKSSELDSALMVVVIMIIAGATVIAGLIRFVDTLEPQIGDIVTFPVARKPSMSTGVIAADPVGALSRRPCVLDLRVMQKSGGSFVIEAVQRKPDRKLLVHWAGVRTSDGQDDCGGAADLSLNSVQFSALLFAAGGTGVKSNEY